MTKSKTASEEIQIEDEELDPELSASDLEMISAMQDAIKQQQEAENDGPRIIKVFGPIDTEMSFNVWVHLKAFESVDIVKPITIIMNSPGGSVTDALAIWDAIQSTTCPVNIVGTGQVMSAAAFLMYAGTKGRRYLTPNTWVMTHQVSFGHYGRLTTHEHGLEAIKSLNERFMGLIFNKATIKGLSPDRKKKRLAKYWESEFDQFMFPEKAITEIGIADHVGMPKGLMDFDHGRS